jgi:hypothetical protein
MNFGIFWTVFFSLMAINFGVKLFLRIQRLEKGKIGVFTKIIICSLPVFSYLMWRNSEIEVNIKIYNSIIAFIWLTLSIVYLYIGSKTP